MVAERTTKGASSGGSQCAVRPRAPQHERECECEIVCAASKAGHSPPGSIAAHGTETLLLPFPPLSTPNNKHAPPPSHRTPVYNSELGAQRCSRICSRYDLLAWALRGQRAAFSSGAAFHRSNPPRLSFTLCGCKTRCFPLSTRAETPRRCEQRAAAARSAHL